MFKLLAGTGVTHLQTKFMEHVATHALSYGTQEEYMFRQEIFNAKVAEFAKINADPANTFTVGTNFMSTWTAEEYKKILGFRGNATQAEPTILSTEGIPAAKDWRSLGAVNAVKNQAQCGSCWAFSTTGAVEGADAIKTGSLKSFSEQQLVSCSKQNSGCNGGLMDYAFQYIKSAPLELEANYPYTSGAGRVSSCSYNKSKGVGTVSAFTDVAHTAGQMRAALGKGPVSVAIEADQMAFQSYTSGVITSGCGTNLDHGVLAVGYGTLDGQDFFLVNEL